jgi:hypothetical protein
MPRPSKRRVLPRRAAPLIFLRLPKSQTCSPG